MIKDAEKTLVVTKPHRYVACMCTLPYMSQENYLVLMLYVGEPWLFLCCVCLIFVSRVSGSVLMRTVVFSSVDSAMSDMTCPQSSLLDAAIYVLARARMGILFSEAIQRFEVLRAEEYSGQAWEFRWALREGVNLKLGKTGILRRRIRAKWKICHQTSGEQRLVATKRHSVIKRKIHVKWKICHQTIGETRPVLIKRVKQRKIQAKWKICHWDEFETNMEWHSAQKVMGSDESFIIPEFLIDDVKNDL